MRMENFCKALVSFPIGLLTWSLFNPLCSHVPAKLHPKYLVAQKPASCAPHFEPDPGYDIQGRGISAIRVPFPFFFFFFLSCFEINVYIVQTSDELFVKKTTKSPMSSIK
ncbi:hypothetical protein AOLI_G00014960 [Acnodon oligacanthus]